VALLDAGIVLEMRVDLVSGVAKEMPSSRFIVLIVSCFSLSISSLLVSYTVFRKLDAWFELLRALVSYLR